MKTAAQINHARKRICERIDNEVLSSDQKILLAGMLNALVWVVDGKASTTMNRVVSQEPITPNKTVNDCEIPDSINFMKRGPRE